MVTEQEQGKSRSASRRRAGADSRRQAILEMLSGDSDGSVTVEEISRALSVSLATVRRDLAALRAEKLITRTYGGAALGTPAAELPIFARQAVSPSQKAAIARRAVQLVEPGDVLLIDAGTTTEHLARALADVEPLTVFTNGLGAINALAEHEGVQLNVLGGVLRRINQTICGVETEETLRGVYASVAFIGADAVDPERGIASRTFEQSRLKALMMRCARQVVVLADSGKLTDPSGHYWSRPSGPWTLVTDADADPARVAAIRQGGLADVIITDPEGPPATADDPPGAPVHGPGGEGEQP